MWVSSLTTGTMVPPLAGAPGTRPGQAPALSFSYVEEKLHRSSHTGSSRSVARPRVADGATGHERGDLARRQPGDLGEDRPRVGAERGRVLTVFGRPAVDPDGQRHDGHRSPLAVQLAHHLAAGLP